MALNKTIDAFSDEVLSSTVVQETMTHVKETVEAYLDTYWTQLHELGKEHSSRQVKEAM